MSVRVWVEGARNAILRSEMTEDALVRAEELRWAYFCISEAIDWAVHGDAEPPWAETLTGRIRRPSDERTGGRPEEEE